MSDANGSDPLEGNRYAISGGLAARLADIQGIIDDLEMVQSCVLAYLEFEDENVVSTVRAHHPIPPLAMHPIDHLQPEIERQVRRALWHAALMAYGRCFSGGKSYEKGSSRNLVPESQIEGFDPDLNQAHADALAFRNRWVGHRVDDLFHEIYLNLPPDSTDVADLTAVTVMAQVRQPTASEMARLFMCADQILNWAKVENQSLTQKLIQAAKAGEARLREVVGGIEFQTGRILAGPSNAPPEAFR